MNVNILKLWTIIRADTRNKSEAPEYLKAVIVLCGSGTSGGEVDVVSCVGNWKLGKCKE